MGESPENTDSLIQKIKHFLIHTSGKTADTATNEEFYQAFCMALHEEVMIHWTANFETMEKKKPRITNFLSMEYLPGRLTGNNLANIGASELVKKVLVKMNRNFGELISCEPDPGLGNGGLGRLASCFLDSLASLHYPARAYGLRYQYGIFEQEIWNGNQVERPDCWLLNINPWELRRDAYATTVFFRGRPIHAQNKHGEEIYLLEDQEEVRALPFDLPVIGFSTKKPFSVLTLRLWSTKESPRNFQLQRYNAGLLDQAAENTCLTDVLYPNDHTETGKRIRLKQEFLLVSASLHDILRRHMRTYGDLTQFADKVRIQINDTHPALVIAELVRTLTKNYDHTWKEAWEICQAVCSYTNHTILREALEEWNEERLRELIPRQHNVIQRLNLEFCNTIRARYPNDEEKVRRLSIIENHQVRMAHLCIVGSHKINGVAELHSEILKKQVFADFYALYPEKFTNVTNGVTHRRWLAYANPLLARFLTRWIGSDWLIDFKQIEKLKAVASNRQAQEEFLSIKQANKEALIDFLSHENAIRDGAGKIISHSHPLDPSALFDVQIKRFHEYKRQLLNALHLLWIIHELKENPNARTIRRFSLFGGKAAPGYEKAKQVILLIHAIHRLIERDPLLRTKLRVAFIENYNVSKAELIIPAADLSEQISTAGWEASGTGNMKLSMNGALTIGTEDGANIEMRKAITDPWWPFAFGASAEENRKPYQPWDLYHHDEAIRRVVDALKDDQLSENESERQAFGALHRSLLEADHFHLLSDLRSYYNAQKKVEALFATPLQWAETALHNIAGMGSFSTDESIRRYATQIWGIEPCDLDPKVLAQVREAYSEHDRCKRVS
jgi:starch phosphorylase